MHANHTQTATVCSPTHTRAALSRPAGTAEPEWPIFSHFPLMRAIKCSRHQYFSVLIRQPVIFPFDEAHEKCLLFFFSFFFTSQMPQSCRRDAGKSRAAATFFVVFFNLTDSIQLKIVCFPPAAAALKTLFSAAKENKSCDSGGRGGEKNKSELDAGRPVALLHQLLLIISS